MHISIIGTAGIPANYGGFETLAENLVKYQSDTIKYTVFCSAKNYKQKDSHYLCARLIYINLNANGISSILYDFVSMLRSLNSDVMLILGVSGSLFLPIIRLLYKGKIITNIDGIEWKRAKWNKIVRFILKISEKISVHYSDLVIGDNQRIIDYIEESYHTSACLIEYGADHVYLQENIDQKFLFTKNRYAISVCRIEPENNIDLILKAFSTQSQVPLVLVGNWQKSAYGKELFHQYSGNPNINLLDPIYDKNIINFLRSNAFFYIHGHSAGGTNPSLVEAMYLELPILAFDCPYNRETTEENCLYWSTSDSLYLLFENYDEKELLSIKNKMKEIAERRYRWAIITNKYEDAYNLFLDFK